jgi:signal transduction histidine kinase
MTSANDFLQLCTSRRSGIAHSAAGSKSQCQTLDRWPISRIGTGPRALGRHLTGLLARPSPPLWTGIVLASALIVAEALVVRLLGRIAPHNIFGAVFLLGVLVISAGWGTGLAVMTTLVSAAVYLEMHLGAGVVSSRPQDIVALAIFLPIALLANALAGQARVRAAEASLAADQVSELAQRQAALRRVATLVARGVAPSEVLTAVADEVANALRVDNAALFRYSDDGSGELVAAHDGAGSKKMPVGARVTLEGDNVAALVLRTGRTARMNSHEHAAGSAATLIRDLGLRSGVGAPIIVDGRLWGSAIVGSSRVQPPPPDTEARLADFAELVATAIANAEARGELMASRARIVTAADEARRRIERDLHDGTQQRLVVLGLRVRSLEASLPADGALKREIADLGDALAAANEELRQMSHGIHPAVLSRGGLRPALRSLGRCAAVPVDLNITVEKRLPESVEVAAYYIVAEALTNAIKHANATLVTVTAQADDECLRVSVADDGVGGANPGGGSGLIGLKDRAEALGGHLHLTSCDHHGTTLSAEIPCART